MHGDTIQREWRVLRAWASAAAELSEDKHYVKYYGLLQALDEALDAWWMLPTIFV